MKNIKLLLILLTISITIINCTMKTQDIEKLQKLYPTSLVYPLPNSDIEYIIIDSCNQVKHVIVGSKGDVISTNIIKPCDK